MDQDLQEPSDVEGSYQDDLDSLTDVIVTVSRLQIALRSRARRLQLQLAEIANQAKAATPEGLFDLLQQSANLLLQHAECWTHVLAGSQAVDSREEALALFNQFSLQEHSKFNIEPTTNGNGSAVPSAVAPPSTTDNPAYLVVTLLLSLAAEEPPFGEIYSTSLLRDVLQDITLMRSRPLLMFELLWVPHAITATLTEAELEAEYADLVPIA